MLGNLRQAVTAQLVRVEQLRQAAERPPQALQAHGSHIDGTTGEDDFGEGYDRGGVMTLTRTEQRVIPAEERDPRSQQAWGQVGRNGPARAAPARNTSTATARCA